MLKPSDLAGSSRLVAFASRRADFRPGHGEIQGQQGNGDGSIEADTKAEGFTEIDLVTTGWTGHATVALETNR